MIGRAQRVGGRAFSPVRIKNFFSLKNSSFNHQNNGNNNKINYYNPTVAQLLELYYGVGTTDSVLSVSGPEGGSGGGENNNNSSSTTTNNFCNNSQFTKIVVVGDKPEKIALLLRVLSYFVRCSSVESKRSYGK